MLRKVPCVLLLLLLGAVLVGVAWPDEKAPEGPVARGDTWHESLLATRERHLERYGKTAVELGVWRCRGTFPASSFAELHVDPANLDLDARDAGGEGVWVAHPEWMDGEVHRFPEQPNASTYVTRMLRVAEGVSIEASLGSDDGMEVWLNGTRVHSHDVPRGCAPDQDRITLSLPAGESRLLLKIHNQSGGTGFYFALENPRASETWAAFAAAFPEDAARLQRDLPHGRHLALFERGDGAARIPALVATLVEALEVDGGDLAAAGAALEKEEASAWDARWLELYDALVRIRRAREELALLDTEALRRAIEHLACRFPEAYESEKRLARLTEIEAQRPTVEEALGRGDRAASAAAVATVTAFATFRREALLANPQVDVDRLLVIERRASHLGLPQNWQGNCSLPRVGYDDRLVVMDPREEAPELETFYRPETPRQIADLDLDFDGKRMLFSMLGSHDRWQIFEVDTETRQAVQVTPGTHPDVDNYDACYLPDGAILFDSTRCFQGIPCVAGSDQVANLFRLDRETGRMRQLCFDQDHDWCPTVMNDGRVLYTRWEYSDTPHYFTRLLFSMNPDGTAQSEYYGSNSYWPNSIFFARPVPGHPTQVVGIVSGHHGVPRMGELVLFDPAKGRFEADGVVQRIPGWEKPVEPVKKDQLVNDVWPRFLHPWPLSETHFLVACQPSPGRPWGIYLADVFDNLLCLVEKPGFALLEPTPLRARERPPVIPSRVDLKRDDAVVYLSDVHHGPGLDQVPRGQVKALRVYEFHYGYNKMGGHKHVGVEGPWDIHRILGTAPVHEDGSASFTVPANTPLAIQPLDGEGKALQLMRSWFTAMPGEVLSCAGCHESQSSSPPVRSTVAMRSAPSSVEPWYGPPRGFSFPRDVQPVLDRHCVGCHDGTPAEDGTPRPDLSGGERGWLNFDASYLALHPYVRRPGPESDYHLLEPLEYHADTSELIQMLARGHHGVELDREAWERLVTWIDLNVPDHGTWAEHAPVPEGIAARRRMMRRKHAFLEDDPERIPETDPDPIAFEAPKARTPPVPAPSVEGWPFDAAEAASRQQAAGLEKELVLDLGDGLSMRFVPVPAGALVMGDAVGNADERPLRKATIAKPFYLGRFEVTREQYGRFDAEHHNGYLNQNHKDHTTPGYPANGPKRPVIRVRWSEAKAFCDWLSKKTGLCCELPTEAEWEWACRAGAATPFSYGGLDTDFTPFANLADLSTRRLAVSGINPQPIKDPSPYEAWLPKDERFDDGRELMGDVGGYAPNAWGLFDMHGNVCEWTATPYGEPDSERRVVKGGSWRDRPKNARAGWRWGYRTWQPVFNVGFRVVVRPATGAAK